MSDDWPGPAPDRIVGLPALHALRGKLIYVVHHCAEMGVSTTYGFAPRGYSEVVIYPWVVGPLVYSIGVGQRVGRNWRIYTGEEGVSFFDVLMTENGDWSNDLRRELTLVPLINYNVYGITPPMRRCCALFETKEAAELWGVQVKLSFTDHSSKEARRLTRRIEQRERLKASIQANA